MLDRRSSALGWHRSAGHGTGGVIRRAREGRSWRVRTVGNRLERDFRWL